MNQIHTFLFDSSVQVLIPGCRLKEYFAKPVAFRLIIVEQETTPDGMAGLWGNQSQRSPNTTERSYQCVHVYDV